MFEFMLGIIIGGAAVLLIDQWRSGVLSPRTHGVGRMKRFDGHPFIIHCVRCDQCGVCGRLRGRAGASHS